MTQWLSMKGNTPMALSIRNLLLAFMTVVLLPVSVSAQFSGPINSVAYGPFNNLAQDLGKDVAGIGDFNGDGYEDSVYGEPSLNRIHIIHGRNSMVASAAPVNGAIGTLMGSIQGPSATQFGYSVSGIGDFDGDGFDDIAVGAPSDGNSGAVYIIYGDSTTITSSVNLSSLPSDRRLKLNGYGTGSRWGHEVNGAGDVDGDGIDDLALMYGRELASDNTQLITNPNFVDGGGGWTLNGNAVLASSPGGLVFLYVGNFASTGVAAQVVTLPKDRAFNEISISFQIAQFSEVTGFNDSTSIVRTYFVDGSGNQVGSRRDRTYNDFSAIGTHTDSYSRSEIPAGADKLVVEIIYVHVTLNTIVPTSSVIVYSNFTATFSSAETRSAILLFGSASGLGSGGTFNLNQIGSTGDQGRRGTLFSGGQISSITGISDHDADGFDDLAISIAETPYNQSRAAYVVYGTTRNSDTGRGIGVNGLLDFRSPPPLGTPPMWKRIRDSNITTAFADWLGATGDIDGDGVADLVVGGAGNRGHLILGEDGGRTNIDNATSGVNRIESSVSSSRVHGIGDIDGDGRMDLGIVHQVNSDTQRIVLFHGSRILSSPQTFSIGTGSSIYDGTLDIPIVGSELSVVAPAGDQDGDGKVDLAIGIPSYGITPPNSQGCIAVAINNRSQTNRGTYQAYLRDGIGVPLGQQVTYETVPPKGVGDVGNGNTPVPLSRVEIGFKGGETGNEFPSRQSVNFYNSAPPQPFRVVRPGTSDIVFKSANAYWKLETNRVNFVESRAIFHIPNDMLSGLTSQEQSRMGVFYTPSNPTSGSFNPTTWLPVPSSVDLAKKTITVQRDYQIDPNNVTKVRDEFNGYYAVFSGEVIYEIGTEILPPPTVNVNNLPLDGPQVTPLGSTFYHRTQKKLFAVAPISAVTIDWIDNSNPTNPVTVATTVGSIVWPGDSSAPQATGNDAFYQYHVIGSPAVDLAKSDGSGNTVEKVRVLSTETGVLDQEVGVTKKFGPTSPGRSLLLYSMGNNEFTAQIYFQRVWSVPFDEPSSLNTGTALVGDDIGELGAAGNLHNLDAGEPWFRNENGFYNVNTYDRSAAPNTGPLFPVNVAIQGATPEEAFDVVYYEGSSTLYNPFNGNSGPDFEIFWPYYPLSLTINWPTPAQARAPIIIASQIGSGPLAPETYGQPSIYAQNVRIDPGPDTELGTADDILLNGFNPNDEHAVLISQGSGPAIFPLRDDLNTPGTSQPFVLLEYLDPTDSDRPSMAVFPVQRTGTVASTDYDFNYDGVAEVGARIEAPYPLRDALFPSCVESEVGALDGNHTVSPEYVFQDRTGAFWVRSADGANPRAAMRYFYPLRPGFYVPQEYKDALINESGGLYAAEETFPVGTCVPWLDDWKNGGAGVPVTVTFPLEWPTEAPILDIAETLVEPKRGLPGLAGAESVDLIYQQSLAIDGKKSVELIDGTRERAVNLQFPDANAELEFKANVRTVRRDGRLFFEDLPDHLFRRLIWDDNTQELIWRGQYITFATGEDMLLPNVMTTREYNQLLELTTNPTFVSSLDSLFDTTQDLKRISPASFVAQVQDSTITPTELIQAIADFDEDGDQDIAVLDMSQFELSVYQNSLNLGQGWTRYTIGTVAGTTPAAGKTFLVTGSFGGNTETDIAVVYEDGSGNTQVRLYISPGGISAVWSANTVYTGAGGVTSVDVSDVDYTDPDDLVLGRSGGDVTWLENSGPSSVWTSRTIASGSTLTGFIVAGDFNGDSRPDVAATHSGAPAPVTIYVNPDDPAGTTDPWPVTPVDAAIPGARVLAAGFLNGDALEDLIVSDFQTGTIDILTPVDSSFTSIDRVRIAGDATFCRDLQVRDLDLDGDLDIAAAIAPTNPSGQPFLRWYEALPSSSFLYVPNTISISVANPRGIGIADIDNDLLPDIYPASYDSSGTNGFEGLIWFQNDGSFRDAFDSLALSSSVGQGEGYSVLLFNNAEGSQGAVTVEVIRTQCPLHRGDVKIIYPDCPFNEKVAVRHNGDFAGQADNYEFEWYYMPAPRFLEILADDGSEPTLAGYPNDWVIYNSGETLGAVDVTIQDPSGELILSDLFWKVRYRPRQPNGNDPGHLIVCNQAEWSEETLAGLTEGWVKRVIGDFGPFRQRATGGGIQGAEDRFVDYSTRTINTIVSMIEQAGERWEGNVPLSCLNVDDLGLIEVYQTVLNRAKVLSIDAAPKRDLDQFLEATDSNGNPLPGKDGIPDAGASAGVSNALLLAAARIADLYTLLGNEAYADASDPTIAFGTGDATFGSLSTAIHPFMNQTASLLEEELKLLRGRDSSSLPNITVGPVYNRLIWNFTNDFVGGEVAYALNYAIADKNSDSLIDEIDAAQMYPQGHGDAWGHMLSAIKAYYDLIRDPRFAWVPRTEPVLVAGQPVEVDYFDERKFASLAANLARVGRDVVDLTYRISYVEDPTSPWQPVSVDGDAEPEYWRGYTDANTERAWGLSGWASRAGQSAYFNWVTANALLPPDDDTVQETSIRKIDRGAVSNLQEIAAAFGEIQNTLDRSDAGLNPLGVATNAVPFDINPTTLTKPVTGGKPHFEQIYERGLSALQNARSAFDFAQRATIELRKQADEVANFQVNVAQQEIDFTNRLIEYFGRPFPDDLGPGKTYPDGYTGPDLIHWMYYEPSQLAAQDPNFFDYTVEPVSVKILKDLNYQELIDNLDFNFTDGDLPDGIQPQTTVGEEVTVTYHISDRLGLVRPPNWDDPRPYYGKIQQKQLALFQSITRFEKAVDDYSAFIAALQDKLKLLELQYNVTTDKITIRDTAQNTSIGLDVTILALAAAEKAFSETKTTTRELFEASKEAVPQVVGFSNDVSAPIRAVMTVSSTVTNGVLNALEIASNLAGQAAGIAKGQVENQANIAIEVADASLEITNAVAGIRNHLLNDSTLRYAIFAAEQDIQQKTQDYVNALAEGERLLQARARFRVLTAPRVQDYRYKDMAFRIIRNDQIQKYRSALDLAARYVYLTAKAYDYETNLLNSDSRGPGSAFLADIVRARSVGVINGGVPQLAGTDGDPGLADAMARMNQNWELVLKSQLGFNNPQQEGNRFSLRRELFRVGLNADATTNPGLGNTDLLWREVLSRPFNSQNSSGIVQDVFDLPVFQRYAIPFSAEGGGLQPDEPAIVIRFGTNINFGQNFFVNLDLGSPFPLGGGDSSYDTTSFATKIRGVGVWFANYNAVTGSGMSNTPRVYLFPVGSDLMRSPTGNRGEVRAFRVVEQAMPIPFPISGGDLTQPGWIPAIDTLNEGFIDLRRYGSFRAYHVPSGFDQGNIDDNEYTYNSRLIGRSVWNTEWYLIIPAGTLHSDRQEGIRRFIWGNLDPSGPVTDDAGNARNGQGVSDIRLYFQTYAYSGS